jgi:2-polyprenyl-6-methoxyphenol hydroxylase-like FAD-dependent oxidoreductase
LTDVVVIGGGPGGSVTAAALVQRGLSVVLCERAAFPRFHLGESLLPRSLEVLDEIGVLPRVQEAFLWKYGARFHDDLRKRQDRFPFAGAWKADIDHAFQVPRDAFDAILLDHAASLGTDVREETTALTIVREDGRAVGVDFQKRGSRTRSRSRTRARASSSSTTRSSG